MTPGCGEGAGPRRGLQTPGISAQALARSDRRVALVFGREADGLTTAELDACSSSVEIESSNSLNLSHAVGIALADLFARADAQTDDAGAAAPPADDKHVDALVARLASALGADDGLRATSRGQVPSDPRVATARRLLRRSGATRDEVDALHAILGGLGNSG